MKQQSIRSPDISAAGSSEFPEDGKQRPIYKSVRPAKNREPQKTSKSKVRPVDPFYVYMRNNYGEHFRRISSWRASARWAVFIYPFISALLFAAPFAILALIVRQLYLSKALWFVSVFPEDSQSVVIPALLTVTLAALVIGLVSGVFYGILRARMWTFEAEKTELSVRQAYFLRRIARSQRKLQPRRPEL